MQADDEAALSEKQARARAIAALFGPGGPYSLTRVYEVPWGNCDGWLIFTAATYPHVGGSDYVAVHPVSGEARYLGNYGE